MNQPLSDQKQHYSEADLLETYYMQPGASMPVMMHLADCSDCASRYERLEKKVRGLSACAHDDKPDTFWARQRFSVMRKLGAQRPSHARIARVAAAAVLVAALGGWFTSRQVDPPAATRVVSSTQAPEIAIQVTTPADPWDSEELDEFQSIVAWESWEPQQPAKSGDQS
jgi:anti-sigma factor RsiW